MPSARTTCRGSWLPPTGKSSNPGPAWVYYLTYSSNGNLIQTPSWVYDGFGDAIDLFINMNGTPWVSGANGQFYVEATSVNASNLVVPGGASVPAPESYAGDMGSMVASVKYSTDSYVNTGMVFSRAGPEPERGLCHHLGLVDGVRRRVRQWPVQSPVGKPQRQHLLHDVRPRFRPGDHLVVHRSVDSPARGRDPGGALHRPAVEQAGIGTGLGTVQNPWVVDEQGQVYYWTTNGWVQAPLFPTGRRRCSG